ncbi:hypothetical protein HK102_008254 [Quaeritorhiza haematococci]|nr:hypothetical protein HK102_008254 [Quaeritorhiza haematococci]
MLVYTQRSHLRKQQSIYNHVSHTEPETTVDTNTDASQPQSMDTDEIPSADLNPPPEAVQEVERANVEFDMMLTQFQERMKKYREEFDAKKTERIDVCTRWHVSSDEEFSHYVATDALKKWLTEDFERKKEEEKEKDKKGAESEQSAEGAMMQSDAVDERMGQSEVQSETSTTKAVFDNSAICCEHGNIDPLEIFRAKRVSKPAAELLTEVYGHDLRPILTTESLCHECVGLIVNAKLQASQHQLNVDYVKQCADAESDTKYWISKRWFNDWKKKAPDLISPDGTYPSPAHTDFSGDLRCEHGNLCLDTSHRRLISEEAYEYLRNLFPDFDTFTDKDGECFVCLEARSLEMEGTKEEREQAAFQKTELKRLFDARQNLRFHPSRSYYLVAGDFLQSWRDFIRNPNPETRPGIITNTTLICDEHGGQLYDMDANSDDWEASGLVRKGFAIVTEEEWQTMFAIYGGGPTLLFRKEVLPDGSLATISDPPVCEKCRHKRRLEFDVKKIFVRRRDTSPSGPGEAESRDKNVDSATDEKEIPPIPDDSAKVIDVDAADEEATKQQSGQTTPTPTSSSPRGGQKGKQGDSKKRRRQEVADVSKYGNSSAVRKSKRLRNQSVVQLTLQKDHNVRDMKLMLMKHFDAPPICQRLFLHGMELTINEAPVEALGIVPGDTIELVLTEEDANMLVKDETTGHRNRVEEGFKGTGLLGYDFPDADKQTSHDSMKVDKEHDLEHSNGNVDGGQNDMEFASSSQGLDAETKMLMMVDWNETDRTDEERKEEKWTPAARDVGGDIPEAMWSYSSYTEDSGIGDDG